MMALPPPPNRQSMSTPLKQIVVSKHVTKQQTPARSHRTPPVAATDMPFSSNRRSSSSYIPILKQPRRTNPVVWCSAILCLVFSLLIIFLGIAILIIFLVIRPRIPLFDSSNASLSAIYFDSPEYFNGDFTLLANFTNPNQRIDVRFEYIDIKLYFNDQVIATQALQPFTLRRKETGLEPVRMISSLMHLPQKLAVALQEQVQRNKIIYNIRGKFRVKFNIGLVKFSYRLQARCQLVMTGPPNGVLVARRCRTKR